jgi:hypothetical protein
VIHKLHVHLGLHHACCAERASHCSPNSFSGGSGSEAREEDPQSGGLLDDLPPRSRFVEYVVEHDRMDIHAACLAWQMQDVFDPPFDVLQKGEGRPQGQPRNSTRAMRRMSMAPVA